MAVYKRLNCLESVHPEIALERGAFYWTAAEDAKLLELKKEGRSWKEIMQNFPERTASAMQTRWPEIRFKYPEVGSWMVKSSRWTSLEDAKFIAGIKAGLSLSEIAAQLPGRSKKSLLHRWHGYLKSEHPEIPPPMFARSFWTEAEDALIIKGKK